MIPSAPLAVLDLTHLPILLVIGLAIFFGTIGANLFQRLRIPQVLGYIAIGLLVGRTGFELIGEEALARLAPFNFFALGIIGFMIGGELHRETFRKYGRQFLVILLAEGIAAFVVVTLGVMAMGMLAIELGWWPGGTWQTAGALALVLGAISSATAPAATVDVLWEYKTRGILTTTVFAIVALDDGLALVLYGVASVVAKQLLGATGEGGFAWAMGRAAYELLGAAGLGVAVGVGLNYLVRRGRDRNKSMAFIIGCLLLVVGLASALGMDVILAAMALGVTLTNLAPRRSHPAFEIVESFSTPIYVLFFVFVGARLELGGMAGWMWILAAVYVIGRSGGKMLGAWLGARWTHAAESVRKYLGLCLFSQAGVAVGLAILSSRSFSGDNDFMATLIVTIVTATTFLVQLIGPPSVKLAVQRAGEVGLNVTEADLARTYRVAQAMEAGAPTFAEATPVAQILPVIAHSEATSYPVTNRQGRLVGLITLAELKNSFAGEGLSEWLVAQDVMRPAPDTARSDEVLIDVMDRMKTQGLESVPVVQAANGQKLAGLLELRAVNHRLATEILRRRQIADSPESPSA